MMSSHDFGDVMIVRFRFRWYYAWAEQNLSTVICRSRGGLSTNEKEENASNDNSN